MTTFYNCNGIGEFSFAGFKTVGSRKKLCKLSVKISMMINNRPSQIFKKKFNQEWFTINNSNLPSS
jgi:hypothetical protein